TDRGARHTVFYIAITGNAGPVIRGAPYAHTIGIMGNSRNPGTGCTIAHSLNSRRAACMGGQNGGIGIGPLENRSMYSGIVGTPGINTPSIDSVPPDGRGIFGKTVNGHRIGWAGITEYPVSKPPRSYSLNSITKFVGINACNSRSRPGIGYFEYIRIQIDRNVIR